MKLILIGLLFMSWTALSQPSTHENLIPSNSGELNYCLPIGKARHLIADALRLRYMDSLNNSLSARIVLLDSEKAAAYTSFTNLLKIEQEKTQYHKEISKHMESLYLSEREQKNYYIKRERNQRRKKNVLTYLGVGLVILIVAR